MRTHFPGTLHEVRSAARFPLNVVHVWITEERRASASAAAGVARMGNSKADEYLEKKSPQQRGRLSPVIRSKTCQPKPNAR
jgi:hypothetical protein